MTDGFAAALAVVLQHEGGFVNDPADAGGPTKFGLTALDIADFYGSKTDKTVAVLSQTDAAEVYRRLFWDRHHLGDLDGMPLTQTVLFDQAVLGGPGTAVSRLQTLLGLHTDGVLGPLTVTAVRRETDSEVAFRFVRASFQYYADIVLANPVRLRFLKGWLDRLVSLLDFVFFGTV